MEPMKCSRMPAPVTCALPAPPLSSSSKMRNRSLHELRKRKIARFIRRLAYAAALVTGAALGQSPVAYVYVAEDYPSATATSPITAHAASSTGQLTQIRGSPFMQTSGITPRSTSP